MANEPIVGSLIVCGVKPDKDENNQLVPVKITVDDSFTPPRLLIELPDRALRDLGVVTIDGQIAASAETGTVYSGTTALTPKFAVIDHAVSGDNEVIAAVASKKLRVLCGLLLSSGTVNVRFESGASGTALTGQMNLVANTGFVIPWCPAGNFETAAGVALNLELSGAVSVDGWMTYVAV